MDRIYLAVDSALLFLWAWFGIRRRWVIAGSVVLAFADIVHDHSVSRVGSRAAAVLLVGMEWCAEVTKPTATLNALTLSFRKMWWVRLLIWIEIAFFAGKFLKAFNLRSDDILAAIASLGVVLYMVTYMSLIPTGPRKKIKFPRVYFGAQAVPA